MTASRLPSDPSGLAAGAELARSLAPAEAEPVQGSLFGAEPAEPDGVGELVAAPRGRGRPPGSRNRSTEEWARFLLTRYRSPLIGLAELAQMTPADLQAELGGEPNADGTGGPSLLDCLKQITAAQAALAPYLHQKQPTAVDAGGAGMFVLAIGDLGAGAAIEGARIAPIADAEEIEENQAVSVFADALSESEGRNE